MSAESVVYAVLSGAAGVTALVGARIYPDVRQQEADLPAIIYLRSGTEFDVNIHGAVDLMRITMAVVCLAATRTGAEAVADAAYTALLAALLAPQERTSVYDPEVDVFATTLIFEYRS